MDAKKSEQKQKKPNVLVTATAGDSQSRPTRGGELARGDTLDKYIIVDKLGEGGMGVVHAAYDPDLDRKVALKLLVRAQGPISRSARARFLHEAQAMARLSNPNVITVFEVGTVGDRDFIAMEYIDGTTLHEWMKGKRTPAEVVSVFLRAGRGLAAAHKAGLAHRDFKPSNVLVANDGRVYVTDFGLARSLNDEAVPTAGVARSSGLIGSLTRTGALMGTPAYMSPEQYDGIVDERSDQFSFCVAFYQALYGERPFPGDTLEELQRSLAAGKIRPTPSGSEVPGWLRSIMERGLAIKPDARYSSMDELLAVLSKPPGTRRRRAIVLGAVAVGVLAAVLASRYKKKEPELCVGGTRNIAAAWNDDLRVRIRTAFSMTGRSYANQAFNKFERVIDGYAERWVSIHRDVCLATVEPQKNDVSLVDLDRQQRCLRQTRNELRSLTSTFVDIDRRGIDSAVEAAYGLRKLSDCTDLEALRRGVAPPRGAEMATQVTAMRQVLLEAESLSGAGRSAEALSRVEPLVDQATRIDYKPVLAEVQQQLGELHHQLKHTKAAEEAFLAAELAAEEVGYDKYRARALVGMTGLLATSSSRFDEARRYGRRARVAIKGSGTDAALLVDLDRSIAHIDADGKHYDKALATLNTRLDAYEKTPGTKPVKLAQLHRDISGLLFELFRYDESATHADQALFILEKELGAGHPSVILALHQVIRILRMGGGYDEARELDKRVRRFWQSERGLEIVREGVEQRAPAGDRILRGRVIDERGLPVAGAEVVSATTIRSDGKYLYVSWGGGTDWAYRSQRVFSDDDGRFEFASVSEDTLHVAAEHGDAGRSWPTKITKGKTARPVTLRLRRFGSVRGKIQRGGKASGNRWALFVAAPSGPLPGISTVVLVGPDGSFEVPRLPAGRYRFLTAAEGGGSRASNLQTQRVTVVAGQVNHVELTLARGTVDVSVRVRGKGGTTIPSAQVFVFDGEVKAKTGRDINNLVFDGANVRMWFAVGTTPDIVKGMEPGSYTVCVLPLDGDFRDPETLKGISQEEIFALVTHCRPLRVDAEPKTQDFTAVVPAVK